MLQKLRGKTMSASLGLPPMGSRFEKTPGLDHFCGRKWPGWAEGLWFASFFWWVLRQRLGWRCRECQYCWYRWCERTNLKAFVELGVAKSRIFEGKQQVAFEHSLVHCCIRVSLQPNVGLVNYSIFTFTVRHTAVRQNMLLSLSPADYKRHLQLWTSGWFLENDSTRWKLILASRRWADNAQMIRSKSLSQSSESGRQQPL